MRRSAVAAVAALLVFPAVSAAHSLFTPSDPLVPKQYYLQQDHAFDAFPDGPPVLNPVRVAIIDSGLDGTHPEFPAAKIWAARSFVGGSAKSDEQGHGTFVAGEIAAAMNNDQGIAGIAFPAQLVIAKIARSDASISIQDEADAIHWAVDIGARVINLSFGGVRDPRDPNNDTFAPEEASAIEYAIRHGVIVVTVTGNSDEAPTKPWPWADYPAALPHVIGVSALTQTGDVPVFSDRDPIYNDISAPGQGIFSTTPLPLSRPGCAHPGYSDCGPIELRGGAGTSFAAPQVTAAAALLLALRPTLKPDQVTTILERSADDVAATNGCAQCPPGRDAYSGWGRLNIAKAIAALDEPLPPADRLEPNDDAGFHAPLLTPRTRTVRATLDFWDDNVDVYRVRLVRGQRFRVTSRGPAGTTTNLLLWKPGTASVNDVRTQSMRAAQSLGRGATHRIAYRVRKTGTYYVQVKLTTRGSGPYTLKLARK